MTSISDKPSTETVVLKKRGGYSGGKPGEQMRPPVQYPAAAYTEGKPAEAPTK